LNRQSNPEQKDQCWKYHKPWREIVLQWHKNKSALNSPPPTHTLKHTNQWYNKSLRYTSSYRKTYLINERGTKKDSEETQLLFCASILLKHHLKNSHFWKKVTNKELLFLYIWMHVCIQVLSLEISTLSDKFLSCWRQSSETSSLLVVHLLLYTTT
jgi:hypothetical protein